MKQIKNIILIFLSLFMISGCQHDDVATNIVIDNTGDSYILNISVKPAQPSDKNLATKTNGFEFEDKDSIGIFAIVRTNNSVPNNVTNESIKNGLIVNVPYIYNKATNSWSPKNKADKILVPEDRSKIVDFYAYSPYDTNFGKQKDGTINYENLSINTNEINSENYKNYDFLKGVGTSSPYNVNINLQFKHVMSYVMLSVSAKGYDNDKIEKIEIKHKYNSANYNFFTEKFSNFNDSKDIVLYKKTDNINVNNSYSCYIIPQDLTQNNTVTTEDISLVYNFDGDKNYFKTSFKIENSSIKTLKSGYIYYADLFVNSPRFKISVNPQKLALDFKSSDTWTYAITDGYRKIGEICKEFIIAKPNYIEFNNRMVKTGETMSAQMIVAYPMSSDGKTIDYSSNKGLVLAVLKTDVNGIPTGDIDTNIKIYGARISYIYDNAGTNCNVYNINNYYLP